MHLSARYIRYALCWYKANEDESEDEELTPSRVNEERLIPLGLPEINFAGLNEVRVGFEFPPNFQFYDKQHEPTRNFLAKWELSSLHYPNEGRKEAQKIFLNARAKESIQFLLTGRLEPTEIATKISRKYKLDITEKGIEFYRESFWDVGLPSESEWYGLFYNNPQHDAYIACMYGSKAQALYRAGFTPHIDAKKALAETERAVALRIEATRAMPQTRETANIIASLSRSMCEMQAVLHGEGSEVEATFMNLYDRVRVKREKFIPKDLRRLTASGSFSDEGGNIIQNGEG